MPIVGTAGHVDHGKSTLVRRLTGRDPDRLAEEKERGLTIDLGFAWTDIGEHSVGFVDVPGHERFIKNMLAGVGGIDVALLVVAADEGWMPQTEEHHAVLELLGIDHGVVALTRTDIAEPDMVELAQLEITEKVAGTRAEGWPMVPVSAVTGHGVDQLTAALARALASAGAPPDTGRPRLWVDRSFVIPGAGTVVTGTLVDGTVTRGDELVLWPGGDPARVRAIQSHEHDVESIGPGNRTALNLAGIDRPDVARGAMLSRPAQFRTTRCVVADLEAVRGLGRDVTDRGAYHVHIGSGSWPARIRLIEAKSLERPGAALITIGAEVPLTQGDRMIVRETGRRAVVAGGSVLDPHPSDVRFGTLRAELARLRATAGESPSRRAGVLLDMRGIAALADLSMDTGGGEPHDVVAAGGIALSRAYGDEASAQIIRLTSAYHDANPLRRGIAKASLASQVGSPSGLVDLLVAAEPALVDDGSSVRLASFGGGWGERQEAVFRSASETLRSGGLAVPRARDLGLDDETLHAAVRSERLVRVADDLVYLPEQIDQIIAELGELPAEFTVAGFRDALGVTRRHAVPLLEWLDRTGVTSRQGDVRRLRQPRERGSDAAPLR